MTRSSAGVGLPWPSLFDVVIQSAPLAPGCTVSKRPYLLPSRTFGLPEKVPVADIEIPASCCFASEVLASTASDDAQPAAPPSPAFQVQMASPECSVV